MHDTQVGKPNSLIIKHQSEMVKTPHPYINYDRRKLSLTLFAEDQEPFVAAVRLDDHPSAVELVGCLQLRPHQRWD